MTKEHTPDIRYGTKSNVNSFEKSLGRVQDTRCKQHIPLYLFDIIEKTNLIHDGRR